MWRTTQYDSKFLFFVFSLKKTKQKKKHIEFKLIRENKSTTTSSNSFKNSIKLCFQINIFKSIKKLVNKNANHYIRYNKIWEKRSPIQFEQHRNLISPPSFSIPDLFSSEAPESGLRAPELCSHSQPCWLASWWCYPASPSDSLLTSPWFPLRKQTARPRTVLISAGSLASAFGTPSMMIVPAKKGS